MFHPPELPFGDPVFIFAVAMCVFLVLPRMFERARVPGLIGVILAGAAIGPNGFGLLERDATIVLLGTVGLLYLMFLVGLELDLDEFQAHRRHAVTFGLLSYLLPQVAGTTLSLSLGYSLPASLLLGAMFASHTLVAYPVASRLRIVRTGAATTVLGATLLTDLLALLTLAIVTGQAGGEAGPGLWARLVGMLAVYVALVLWLVPRLGRWFMRRAGSEAVTEYVFVLTLLFGFAGLAEVFGIEPIIGALLVGFALNRLVPEKGPLMNRIRFMADAFFVPFFLLSVGMLVDVRAFGDRTAWLAIGALVGGTVASKALAAKVTQRLFGFRPEDGWLMFGLSVSHAAATMAITLVGYEAGLFDGRLVNAIVVVILVTCLVGPWVVQRAGRLVALREAGRPYEPGSAPQRILIPLANPATSDVLLDLAIAVRNPDSREPLQPLMVVRERGGGTEAGVAKAELLLGHAVNRAVDAGVPVVPLTRVDLNVAVGIARARSETRATIVVMGWDGGRSGAGGWIFGSVLDQVLAAVPRQVLVARIGHPLSTLRRVVLVYPPAMEHHPGLYESLIGVKRIASQAGASITGIVMNADPEPCGRALEGLRPHSLPVHMLGVRGWEALLSYLRKDVRPDDLVVLLSARRGTLSWNPKLERLPEQLARLEIESFLVLYPSQTVEQTAGALPGLAAGLPEGRVIRLDGVSFGTAIARLARLAVRDRRLARLLRRELIASELEFSNEIIPGVLLPHARLPDLDESILLLAISPEGLVVPGARAPVRLVFLLLSPLDRPQEHLRHLAEIARFLKSPDRVAEVLRRHAPDLRTDWLGATKGGETG